MTGAKSDSTRPTISVVMPAYNAEKWIAETLGTVFAQSDPADEVIVVDDGSTDGTLRALTPFAGRLKVVEQTNAGCGNAFNTGIRTATADFVALCPADDLWHPEKLAWQRQTLSAHPDVDVSFGAATNFGLSDAPFARPSGVGILDTATFAREMFERNVIPDPSVVVRRSLVLRLGGFVPEVGEDYEFWMRALRAGATFHFDERELVRLRQHGGNLSSQALAIHEMNFAVHRAAAAAMADRSRVNDVLARDLAAIGRCHAGLGRHAQARSAFRRSVRLRPSPVALFGFAALAVPGSEWLLRALHRARTAP